MVELRAKRLTLTGVFAEPSAIDGIDAADAFVCRVAPDEALVVGGAGGVADPHAVTLDVTDGWSVFALTGDAPAAVAHLSDLELPDEGFVQGEVAHVPAKLIVRRDEVLILVPSIWGEHVRDRILQDCPGVIEVAT